MQRAQVEITAPGSAPRPFFYRPGSSDDRVIQEVLRQAEYDFARLRRGPELRGLYERLVGAGKTPLIVDAGANIGASAIWFALTFPAAHIVAVEPEAENFELLRANTEGAPVEPIRAALTARSGPVSLTDPGHGAWGYRTTRADKGVPAIDRVDGLTVGEIYAAHAGACVPFIVKIDIEGGETELFSSRTQWVAQTPLIAIELHDWVITGQGGARPFLKCVAALDRDFVYVGENVFSIDNDLGRFPGG